MMHLRHLLAFLFLSLLPLQAELKLDGLVYEAEDWTEPKDAWLKDQTSKDKWNLWTTEEGIENKRSRRASLQSPVIREERKTSEEGAPALHTKITGIPKGFYQAILGRATRPIGYSFDGKNWLRSETGETILGFYNITDGTFELWIDDRFANPGNIGTAYYDYIRFLPVKELPRLYDFTAFTLPNGQTQLTWISSTALKASKVVYGTDGKFEQEVMEAENGQRNHVVVLPALQKGKNYTAQVVTQLGNSLAPITSSKLTFVAGYRPSLAKSKNVTVPLTVSEPTDYTRGSWPVVSGVPFAQGVLASEEDVVLLDADRQPVPAEFKISTRWPDGSARWLTVAFNANTEQKTNQYFLQTGENLPKAPEMMASPLVSGVIRAIGNMFTHNQGCSLEVVLNNGERLVSQNSQFEIVEESPFCMQGMVTLDLLDGQGTPVFAFKLKLTGYNVEPEPVFNFNYSLTNVDFKSLKRIVKSVTLNIQSPIGNIMFSNGKQYSDKVDVSQFLEKEAIVSSNGQNEKLGHFDGFITGEIPNAFPFALLIQDFWQTYPKGVSISPDMISIALLPELPRENYPPEGWNKNPDEFFMHFYWYKDGGYVWKQGLEVEQRLSFMPLLPDADLQAVKAWMETPPFAQASSEYYCNTLAFSNIHPSETDFFPEYDIAFDENFKRLEEGRVKRGEYGWLNYGDWFGERRWNWGNNEYDLTYTCAIQFARTGKLEYLERARQMVRHYATVDILHFPADKVVREPIYEHCCGHVGDYITKKDSIYVGLGKNNAMLGGVHDGTGGHALHVGMYLMANLLGEPHYADVAYQCSWNQAKRYTPNYHFTIERTVGWSIINNIYAYQMTGNPFFLNACNLFFEAIREQQNPETGCFDLPQDQTECECPDKKDHRGGKPFATGVMMHGLIRLYETTHNPEIKTVIVRIADWLLDTAWNPKANGWRYKTGCPKYANGGSYSILAVEGITYASQLTGNPRYAQFIADTIGKALRSNTGTGPSCGKSFTQFSRQTSHTLYNLHKILGIKSTQINKASVFHAQSLGFLDENGQGAIHISFDKMEKGTLPCLITIGMLENATVKQKTYEKTFAQNGLQVFEPIPFTAIDKDKPVVVEYRLKYNSRESLYKLTALPLPPSTAPGQELGLAAMPDNWTAISLKMLGAKVKMISDLNNVNFGDFKAIVFGADSLGGTMPKIQAETAAKMAAFVRGGGKVVFMQLNDSEWNSGFTPAILDVVEPNGTFAKVLKPEHPLFKGLDASKLVGAQCYDSIVFVQAPWNVLAVDNVGHPAIAELAFGKGTYMVVMPSFDRFHVPEEHLDLASCKLFLNNLLDLLK